MDLYRVDLQLKSCVFVKRLAVAGANFDSFGFDNQGNLYGWDELAAFTAGKLYRVDGATGNAQLLGSGPSPSVLGSDYDNSRGVFWISDEWNGKVYQISATNASLLWTSSSTWYTGSGPGDLLDMDVAPNGDVLISAKDNGLLRILKLDVASGQWASWLTVSGVGYADVRLASLPNSLPPAFVRQPADLQPQRAAAAQFSVEATGQGTLSYQWQKDGVDIPGAVGSSLSIASAQPWHIGSYRVKVTDSIGSALSREAVLSLPGVDASIWNGLVGYYPLDGNGLDLSPRASHLEDFRDITMAPDRFGNPAKALKYISSKSFYASKYNTGIEGNNSRTISLWVRVPETPTRYDILGFENPVYDPQMAKGFMMGYYGDRRHFWTWGSYADYFFQFPSGSIQGKWVHLVYSYNGTTTHQGRMYLNGVLQAGTPIDGDVPFITPPGRLRLGSRLTLNDGLVDGLVDEVRLYSRGLSAGEVSALYQAESAMGTVPQNISFAQIDDQLANSNLTLTATGGGSGLPVGFFVSSGPAVLSGNQLSFTGAGTVAVTANQQGNTLYANAEPVTRTFQVRKALAKVSLSALMPTYTGSALAASVATDPAGLAVDLTYNGAVTPPRLAGSYTVVATVQDPLYEGSATATLEISRAPQTLQFAAIPDKLATETLSLAATGGGSGNPVSFEVTSGPGVINDGVLSFTGAGSVSVRASQLGNENYLAAESVTRTTQVRKAISMPQMRGLLRVADGSPARPEVVTDPPGLGLRYRYGNDLNPPRVAGYHEVQVDVEDARYEGWAGGMLTILGLRGLDKPVISAAPAEIGNGTDFGEVPIGRVISRVFLLENPSLSPLDLTEGSVLALLGAQAMDFDVVVPERLLLPPQGSLAIEVRFAPTQVGLREAVLLLNSPQLANGPLRLKVQGLAALVAKRTTGLSAAAPICCRGSRLQRRAS